MSRRCSKDLRKDILLMDDEEFSASEEFNKNFIQPKILEDWYANDSALLLEYLRFAEQFRPSLNVAQKWMDHFKFERQERAKHDEIFHRLSLERIERSIQRFKDNIIALQRHNEEIARYKELVQQHKTNPLSEVPTFDWRAHKSSAPQPLKHKLFLPRNFATELVSVWNQYFLNICQVYICLMFSWG